MTNDPALMLQSAVTVLRRQRQHVRGDTQRAAAYRAGLRSWYGYYGRQLAAEMLARAAAGDWRRALHGLAVLLRDPALLLQGAITVPRPAVQLLWRQRRSAQAVPGSAAREA